jgi:PST family polysaccharide transporter
MEVQVLALGPLLVLFSIGGDQFISIAFGPRWVPAFSLFPFIAVAYLTNTMFALHSSALYVFERNWGVAMFHTMHLMLFGAGAYFLIPVFGLIGYGFAEFIALPSYIVLDLLLRRTIGAPHYSRVAAWYLCFALALLTRQLSIWACLIALAPLAWPGTFPRIRGYARLIWQLMLPSKRAPSEP